MPNCNETATNVELLFDATLALARSVIEAEQKLVSVTFLFPFLIPLYSDEVIKFRAALDDQLTALMAALTAHADCWEQRDDVGCSQTMLQIRAALLTLSAIPHPEMHDFRSKLENHYTWYRNSLCARATEGPIISPDEVEAAENIDLELHVAGRFPTRKYAVPAEEVARGTFTIHKLKPRLGSTGPIFWIQCVVFDIKSWTIGANARVIGSAVPTESPFIFEWTFEGAAVTQGVNSAASDSSVEFSTPTKGGGRELRVKVTSKSGTVLEHVVFITTRPIREDCSAIP